MVLFGPRMWSLVRVSGKQLEKNVKMLYFPQENVLFTNFLYFSSFLDAIKLKFFFGRCCEYKLICSSFKSLLSLPHERRERFSWRSKIITKNSECIRGIKRRELADMYRDDFQNILRKQRPSLFILRSFIQPGHRSRTKDR